MVIAKVRRLFRRRLRRIHWLPRKLRRDINRVIWLNKEITGSRDEILKLAKLASLDKKQIRELRSETNDLLKHSKLEIDAFVNVFVDAETMIFDVHHNILQQLNAAIAGLESQGFPEEYQINSSKYKFADVKKKFGNITSKLQEVLDDIKMLVRKAERGTIGGVSVASTLQLEHKVKRLSKFIYIVRSQITELFDKLAEKEVAISILGVHNTLNLLFNRIERDIDAIRMVARDNRILAKRFKEMLQDLAKGLRSTSAPDNIKAIVANTAGAVEDYEEKALKQARKMAYREYRIIT